MKILLVAGGTVEPESSMQFIKKWKPDKIIGIDRGMEFLYEQKLTPDLLVGDFDSACSRVKEHYRALGVLVRQYRPEKDATDTEIGVRAALEMGAGEITILGATGTRIDHMLGNIQVLMLPLQKEVKACLLDAHNRIRLLSKRMVLKKEHMFGDYVSFLPLTTRVEGLTLTGFKYPLEHYTMTSDNSLGISNEIAAEEAEISFQKGILIMVEAHD